MAQGRIRHSPGGLAAVVLLLGAAAAGADRSLSLYIENDSRLLKPNHSTDRHYTSGVKIVYGFRPDWSWLQDFAALDVPLFGVDSPFTDAAAGLFFGQNLYTPDHADEPARRDPRDMSFAGWLYGGLFAQRASGNVMDQAALSIGVIGPAALGREAQNTVHRILGGEKAHGWSEQIGNEPAVDLSWTRRLRPDGSPPKDGRTLDWIAEYGFRAGSVQCGAAVGLTGRLGLLTLPDDFGPGRLTLPSGVLGRSVPMKKNAYLFARLAGVAVAYDRFLTGLAHEPLVGQVQVGVVYQHNSLEVGYSQTFETRRFEHQDGTDAWGALTVTWHF